MQNLVIVESPTKAKTLSKFLGSDYQVEASMGHIRDLPKSKLGVNVDKNFEPEYIIPKDKQKIVTDLKKVAHGARQIWLATDPDREGEAIAWHVAFLLGSKDYKRVVFHEITEDAIKEAFNHPRGLDNKLIDAQQARRVLDRLVGYKLSPLLWKKVKRGLSAGRVQSVALRLLVEREKEIEKFIPVEYWSLDALLELTSKEQFYASLIQINEKKAEVKDKQQAEKIEAGLKSAKYLVKSVTKKETKRHPVPPFTTSTLQQTAGNKLGFSAKKTMATAQFLYEHGLITYMRTDSVNLSPFVLNTSREFISKQFGKQYLPPTARVFKTKSKLAQEAHEAIRPTNVNLQASQIQREGITRDHIRLYDLIWKRMIASQMTEAILDQTSVDVLAKSKEEYILRATGSVIKFDGWLKVYGVTVLEEEDEPATAGARAGKQVLPEMTENEKLKLLELLPEQHFTEPPPRYNEASLIKKLEELGIGRPSTYAPTLSTIQERFYVEKKERRFFTTPLGIAVIEFLEKNFSDILDYKFTAHMEDELDEIAHGERKWQPVIKEFYTPFEKKVETTDETAKRVKIEAEEVDKKCSECGKPLQIKYGRFGKFLACTGFPDCKHTESFEEILNIKCPQDGGDVVLRKTKKGRPFYGCKNYPKCKFASWTKPKTPGNSEQGTGDSKNAITSS